MTGDRETFLSHWLTIAQAFYLAEGELKNHYWRLGVIGPDAEEVERLAPELSRHVHDKVYHPSMFFPLRGSVSVRQLIEHCILWKWSGDGIGCQWLAAFPPDCDLVLDLPDSQRKIPRDLLRACDPRLAVIQLLFSECGCDIPYLALLPIELTRDERNRPLRTYMGDRFVTSFITNRDLIRRGRERRRGKQTPMTLQRYWHEEAGGTIPKFLWITNLREGSTECSPHSDEFAIAGLSCTTKPPATHIRRLSPNVTNRIQDDPAYVKTLLEVATGEGTRNEDDTFVHMQELLRSGYWLMPNSENRDRQARWYEGLGYPLIPIGKLCDRVELFTEPPASGSHKNDVWMVIKGPHAASVSMAIPPADDFPAFRLRCGDPDFLWRLLNDERIIDDLKCRSGGSFNSPIIGKTALREMLIPWPSEAQRIDLREKIRQLGSMTEGFRGLVDELEDLTSEMNEFADDMEVSESFPVLPWNLSLSLEDASSELDQAAARLRAYIGRMESVPRTRTVEPTAMPGPIAILQRRIANSANAHERLSLVLNLAEIVIRYDAALLLTQLEDLNKADFSTVLAEACDRARTSWRPTLGHWKQLGERARKKIGAIVATLNEPTETRHTKLRRAMVAKATRDADDLKGRLVEARNRLQGHGFTLNELECKDKCIELFDFVSKLIGSLGYLSEHKLIFVEKTDHRKNDVELSVRWLVGDYEDYSRDVLRGPHQSQFSRVKSGIIHVVLAIPDEFLPLSPWLHFGPDADVKRDAIWFLDMVSDDVLTYASPQMPGKRIDLKGEADQFWSTINTHASPDQQF